jgi:hypothetical protein
MSVFCIIIAMFFDDHNPPHFYARYGGEKPDAKKYFAFDIWQVKSC